MSKVPQIANKHRICVVCEGEEDFAYFKRLTELGVWDNAYMFDLKNAKSASNIPAMYTNVFQNNSYEAVLVFCDTDKAPHREYSLVKKKILQFHGNRDAVVGKVIIFANPCTMQIILAHFDDIKLTNQGKKTNATVIEQLTGVPNYDAHAEQIAAICAKIFRRTYQNMRSRVSEMNHPDTVPASTNFIEFLNKFESADARWLQTLSKYLTKAE